MIDNNGVSKLESNNNAKLKDFIKSKRHIREECRRSSRSRTDRFREKISNIVDTQRELEERRNRDGERSNIILDDIEIINRRMDDLLIEIVTNIVDTQRELEERREKFHEKG